ncbi:MAG: RsmE family RNA methyltransferase [Halobacteriovoraceae bacterium]|nr:RsmE family RNA methyltransferase [Halobacteriovoraceae bacterium]
MRAVFLDLKISSKSIRLDGEQANHLIKVVRIKEGEEVLGFTGKGKILVLRVSHILKKHLEFDIKEERFEKRKIDFDVLVCKVKKEAMNLTFKECCELGVNKIIVASSEYSQSYPLNLSKVQKILKSGIEQANNPYLPQLEERSLKELNFEEYDSVIYFSSQTNSNKIIHANPGKTLIVFGPEGGLSEKEELGLRKLTNSSVLKLETNIMRTPTAVACGVGYYLGASS